MKKALLIVSLVLILSVALFAQAPKYIFLFIGDGMGTPQTNAAQMFKSTLGNAEVPKLNMLTFPVQGMTTTYSADAFITDSAAAGTALASGYKTNSGVVGLDPTLNTILETISEKVHAMGWKVGIISTVSIDHATPASFYAHQASRSSYYQIARQLVESGFEFFGGGDIRYPTGRDKDQESVYAYAEEMGYKVIQTQDGFEQFDPKNADCEKAWIINEGVVGGSAMQYALDKPDYFNIADITRTGIDYLDNEEGFFMMIEGGKIDWACHANDAAASIDDTLAFDKAIKEAMKFYNEHPEETLIVVTGDHECGGLTLGFAGTKYDSNPELIRYQKESYDVFTNKLETMKENGKITGFEEDVLPMIENAFGLYTEGGDVKNQDLLLTPSEVNKLENAYNFFMEDKERDDDAYVLYGYYNPVSVTCTHILNNKAGIAWTSYSHTGVPVVTYAMGNGQDLFSGYYDNTDIAKNLFSLVK